MLCYFLSLGDDQVLHCVVGDHCFKHSHTQKDVSISLCLHIPEWGNSPAWIQHKWSFRTRPLTLECLGRPGHPVKGQDENHSTTASLHYTAVTHVMSCLLVGLPAAHGTRGPSSSTAAASSSLPHTSSGGPLHRYFAGKGTEGEEVTQEALKQEKNAVASNVGKHECGRNMEAGKGGRGKHLWLVCPVFICSWEQQ